MFRTVCLGLWLCLVCPAAPVKVAFVGDSITEGAGLGNPGTESYPAKLQRLLGSGYTVGNYGVSGRTLLRKGDFPYWKELAYTRSRDFQPDIVFILLGTNDSKPQNWRHSTNFVTDLEDLIASYRALPTNPRIVLGTPPPVFRTGAFDIRPLVVADEIAPLVRQVAAAGGGDLVDLHTRLLARGEWFPDTVHPDSRGTSGMAAVIWETLTGQTSELPPLEVVASGATRSVLTWPAAAGGWVVQTTPALQGVSARWVVLSTPAYHDGQFIRLTNSPGAVRFYRMVRP
ncbi:MAG: sialate O-acetylesterase [Verrucomicrobia bacterium]|nr:sialate O-acetylesterase [Verrucomicrobiota bacterium]